MPAATRYVSLLTLIVLVGVGKGLCAQGSADPADIRSLSEGQKQSLVLAALDHRDRDSENVAFVVRASDVNVSKVDGSREFMFRSRYEVRRLHNTLWMRVTNYESYQPEGGIVAEAIVNWDGAVARGMVLPEYTPGNRAQCRVSTTENDNLARMEYMHLLGLRAIVGDAGDLRMPVAQWLRDAIEQGDKLEISNAEHVGRRVIRVAVYRARRWRELFLDPARGFMTVGVRAAFDNDAGENTIDVIESREVSSVWVPTKAIQWRGSRLDKERTEVTYQVDQFSIGTVKDSDTEIVFPVGSKVMDTVQRVFYTIRQDGKLDLQPFADPSARTVYDVPTTNTVVDGIDQSTTSKYQTRDLVLGPSGAPGDGSSAIRRWTAALLTSLCVGLLYYYMRYRRRPVTADTGTSGKDVSS